MTAPEERGQATVELALCLPLVLLLVGSIVEVTSATIDNIRLWQATREAARVATVEPDEQVAIGVARSIISPLDISVSPSSDARVAGEPVTVQTAFRPSGKVPLIGPLLERVELRARVAMRIEVP